MFTLSCVEWVSALSERRAALRVEGFPDDSRPSTLRSRLLSGTPYEIPGSPCLSSIRRTARRRRSYGALQMTSPVRRRRSPGRPRRFSSLRRLPALVADCSPQTIPLLHTNPKLSRMPTVKQYQQYKAVQRLASPRSMRVSALFTLLNICPRPGGGARCQTEMH